MVYSQFLMKNWKPTDRHKSYYVLSLKSFCFSAHHIFLLSIFAQLFTHRFLWLSRSTEPPLLSLPNSSTMFSYVLEVKIPTTILQVIYIKLYVIRVLTPLSIMTFKEEKKFQWNFFKILNYQWFQLLCSPKIMHLPVGA